MIKSKNDGREYRLVTLDNKLDALIISDPTTTVCAASISIKVGSYHDPIEFPGLAHFLEHMLFMGTEKYPDEDRFMAFISEHGGSTNAYTAIEETNYFFDIQKEHFDEALDIFSQFFINPLFNESCVDREIEAVNNEHSKNIPSDLWRLNRVLRRVSNPDHPFSKFSTGNLETLKKAGIRDNLISFYEKHYSANLMKLVIYTDKNLVDGVNAVQKYFSSVKNKGVKPLKINSAPFISEKTKYVKIVPIVDEHSLHIIWQLPNSDSYFRCKPLDYITHILGHEGENSLEYHLKQLGWITGLSVSTENVSGDHALLKMSIVLTDDGFSNIPSILRLGDRYRIDALTCEKYLYDELRVMRQHRFDYLIKSQPDEYVMELSSSMHIYPAEYTLYGPYCMSEYTEEAKKLVEMFLQKIDDDKQIILIVSKKYEGKLKNTEHFYKIKYEESFELDRDFHSSATKFNTDFSIPIENRFIPDSIRLLGQEREGSAPPPQLIKSDDNFLIWYKKDNTFSSPHIITTILLNTPEIYRGAEDYNKIVIFLKSVRHRWGSTFYQIRLANSKLSVGVDDEHFIITIVGYRENFPDIVDCAIRMLTETTTDTKTFNYLVSDYRQNLENYKYSSLLTLSNNHLKEKIYKRYHSPETLLGALPSITLDDVNNFRIHSGKIKILVHGNLTKDDAEEFFDGFKIFIKMETVSQLNLLDGLDPGSEQLFLRRRFNDKDGNSLISVHYEIDKMYVDGWESRYGTLLILHNYLKNNFFNQLRTIEQHGYIVFSSVHLHGDRIHPMMNLKFTIVSSTRNPDAIKKRINRFVKKFRFTEEIFYKHRKTTIKNLEKPSSNIFEEFNKNLDGIYDDSHIFDKRKRLINVIKKITFEEFNNFYEIYFKNRNSRKVRIVKIYREKIDVDNI